jgi:hypothetical protein
VLLGNGLNMRPFELLRKVGIGILSDKEQEIGIAAHLMWRIYAYLIRRLKTII